LREETWAHILCECEALASPRHAYLGSFFLEPGDIRSLVLGAIMNTVRLRGSYDLIWGTKGPLNQGLGASGMKGPEPKCKSINQSPDQDISAFTAPKVSTVPTISPVWTPTKRGPIDFRIFGRISVRKRHPKRWSSISVVGRGSNNSSPYKSRGYRMISGASNCGRFIWAIKSRRII